MSLKFYMFLLLVISVTSYSADGDHHDNTIAKSRTKRGAFWDFFHKIVTTGNLVFDQYNDTKVTLNEIYDLVSDGFSDGKPTKRPRTTTTTTSATPSSDNEVDGDNSTMSTSTTTEKYRITRYELGRIAGRNLRGLKRLLNIEIKDALNQSQYNIAEYQRQAKVAFANSVIADKKGILVVTPANSTTTSNSTRS